MNDDDDLGRSIATIARWYEPGEPPDPAELDRRHDDADEPPGRFRLRPVLATAATVAVVVGALVMVRVLRTDGESLRTQDPATSDVPSDSSPTSGEPEVPQLNTSTGPGPGTTADTAREDDPTVDPDREPSPVRFASEWRPVSTSPLSPRNAAIGAWTGSEVLIFGGTTVPMCPVCDYVDAPEPLLDGAAYDPSADTWRTIAPPPAQVSLTASAVVVGDVVFVAGLGGGGEDLDLWSYSVPADEWSRIDVPRGVPVTFPMSAPGNRLAFARGEITDANARDHVYDPSTDSWSILPESPFGEGWFDRSYLGVDGQLVLFAKRPLSDVEPDEPNVVAAAMLDESAGTWRRLPDSQQLGAPYFTEGSTAVNPERGGANGGQVNGWGRVVPNGGEFRLDDESWHPFPIETPEVAWQGGVAGTASATYRGVQGDVYDVVTGDWHKMPTLPSGFGNDSQMTIVAAGLDVFVFGGFDGQTDGMPVSNTAYLLDADRPPTPEAVASTTTVTIAEPTVTRPYVEDPNVCVAASASETNTSDFDGGLLRPFTLSPAGWHRFQIIADPELGVDGRWALVGTIPANGRIDAHNWNAETEQRHYDTINDWPVAITASPNGYTDALIDLGGETDAYVRTYRFELDSIRTLISQLAVRPPDEPIGFEYAPTDALPGLDIVLDRGDEPVSAEIAVLECVVEDEAIIRIASITGDPLAQYVVILDQPYPSDIGRLGDAVISIVYFGRLDDPLRVSDVSNAPDDVWSHLLEQPPPSQGHVDSDS